MSSPLNAVPGGIITSKSPPFKLPIRYMMLGILGFAAFAVDLVCQSFHFGQEGAFLPAVVALTHLLTLGSLLAFVMGAVYQLSTVAFLVSVRAPRLAGWNFWLYGVSVIGLISSMARWWLPGLMAFGSLATLSIFIYAGIMIASVQKTQVQGAMKWFILSAHVYLILAISTAWFLIFTFYEPGLSSVESQLLATHIILAVGGFFTCLVMGFSFKLLPMFTLSHGFPVKRQKWTLLLLHAAIVLLLVGVWANLIGCLAIGGLAGVLAFVNQIFDIRSILKKRLRKKIEPPIRVSVVTTIAGVVGLCIFGAQLIWKNGIVGWQTVVTFYVLGWITFTVMSYAYKIVPFLVWSRRYSRKVGQPGVTSGPAQKREKVPLIADLIDLRRAWPVLGGFGGGLIILTLSSAFSWPVGAVIGCCLIALAILTFTVQISIVIDIRKVRSEFREEPASHD